MNIKKTIYILFFTLFFYNCTGTKSNSTLNESDLFNKTVPSIVLIYALDSNSEIMATGTGFVIDGSGVIATNYHVIENASFLDVEFKTGEKYSVKTILATDKHRDIALIKIVGFDLPSLKLGNSNKITVGDKVIAIGNPLGLTNTLSSGIISGIRTDLEDYKLIQTTTPISPGSSGGPLLNMNGEVIGLTTMYLKGGQNLNFVVPINYLRALNSDITNPIEVTSLQEDLELKKILADQYYDNYDYYNAIDLYSEIIKTENNNPALFYKLAYSLHGIAIELLSEDNSDWEEYGDFAIENYKKVIELEPDYEYVYPAIQDILGLDVIEAIKNKKMGQMKEKLKEMRESGTFFPFVLEAGRASLSSCNPNSLLFTSKEEETQALWYLQEIEKVRPDVTVIQLKLLHYPYYIKYLRDFKGIDFGLTDQEIDDLTIKDWPETRREIIKVNSNKNKNQFNVNSIRLTIDHSYVDDSSVDYLSISDQMTLLLIKKYINEKDIYFGGIDWVNYSVPFSLYKHTVSEGLVEKLVPQPKDRIKSYEKWEENLMNNYRYNLFSDPRIIGKDALYSIIDNYRYSFEKLATIYKYRGDKSKVKNILSFGDTVIPEANIPIPYETQLDIYSDNNLIELYNFADLDYFECFKTLDTISAKYLEITLSAAIDTPLYYQDVSDFYSRRDKFDSSYKYINEYLKYEPNDEYAKASLMYINFQLGNDDEALPVAYEFLLKNPDVEATNQILAYHYFDKSQYDSAQYYFDRLLNINRYNYSIYNTYGLSYLYQNQYDLALNKFQKVLDYAPQFSIGYKYGLENIAETHIFMKEEQRAIEIYTELIESDPTLSLGYAKLAILNNQLGNTELEKSLLQIAIDNMWEGNYGQLGLACYYSYTGDLEKSTYYLKTALDLGFSDIGWIKFDPHLNNLRKTEEYLELIKNK